MKTEKFNPLVSIIIPVYNGSNFVGEAIDSALAQTYRNIEIVVVNDGSTDNTEEILKKYGSKIKYYNKTNGGTATALNLAIEKSKGEYISWLSHDDVYLKEKIQINIEILLRLEGKKRQNTILHSNYIVIDEKSNKIWETSFQKLHPVEKLNSPLYPLFNGILHGCSLLIPKKCFIETGEFDTKLLATQDFDLWYKMFPKYNIRFIDTSTIKIREHSERGSRKNDSLKECDDLWINMINSVSLEQINFMYGGLLPFYERTLKVVSGAGYTGVSKYLEQKISEYMMKTEKFNPLVSIIIPVYNGANFAREAIDSALAQTYENIEIIVVNDGSTDNTEEILKSYGSKIIYYNKANGGTATALNLAIEKSKGEYLSWLSHDDLYCPNKISEQIEYLSKYNNKNLILYSNVEYIDKNSNSIHRTAYENTHTANHLNYGLYAVIKGLTNGCALLIPKACFNHLGMFDEKSPIAHDYDMWFRLARFYEIRFIPKVLIKYRLHDRQSTNTSNIFLKEANKIWIKILADLSVSEMLKIEKSLYVFYLKMAEQMKATSYCDACNFALNLAKKQMPKLTVIIPCHNTGKYLSESINSILNQSFYDFELIIIDDFSTDNCWEIISDYKEKDFRIIALKNKKNLGISKTINIGLKTARGEYITIMDSSDISLPQRLEKQIHFLDNLREYGLCSVNISRVDSRGRPVKEANTSLSRLFVRKNPTSNASSVYRSEIIKDHLKTDAGYDFFLKNDLKVKIFQIDEVLYGHRIHNESILNGNTLGTHKDSIKKWLIKTIRRILLCTPGFRKMQTLEDLIFANQAKMETKLEELSANTAANQAKMETKFEGKLESLFNELKNYVEISSVNKNINLLGEEVVITEKAKSRTFEYHDENRSSFFEKLKKYILKTDIVLDIGCGINPQTFFVPKVHICVEPFEEYRNIIKPYFPNKSFLISIRTDALTGIKDFDDNSVDTIFLLDLIEHLDKNEGFALLKEVDRVARKQVIVWTPLGFYLQHYESENEKDAWGLSGSLFQEHKSGWLPEDFGEGWDFHISRDSIEPFLEEEKKKNIKYSGLMAIKTKKFTGFPIQPNTPDFVKTSFINRRTQYDENNDNSRN